MDSARSPQGKMSSPRFGFALLAVLMISGCVGADFTRPDPDALALGKSRIGDVTAMMGTPRETGEVVSNGHRITTLGYMYMTATGEAAHAGVAPARQMVFGTYNRTLVSEEFISSFKEDSTDFDESRIENIVKGKSTKADVIRLLGRPSGEAVFPVVKKEDERALIYSYSQIKRGFPAPKPYRKTAVIILDPTDVVSDVEFSSAGEK